MVCQEYDSLLKYLREFNGTDPVGAAACPFMNDAGAGIPVGVMSLLTFGFLGLALTARTQHPAPLLVAILISGSTIAATIPGIAAKIVAVVVLFTLTGAALFVYERAQGTL